MFKVKFVAFQVAETVYFFASGVSAREGFKIQWKQKFIDIYPPELSFELTYDEIGDPKITPFQDNYSFDVPDPIEKITVHYNEHKAEVAVDPA